MSWRSRILVGLGGAAIAAVAAVTACAPLTVFDTFVPKDAGSRTVASGLAYGEGPRRMLDVYAPAAGAEGRPVVVFFYGGSWDSGRREDYAFAGRAIAAEGFVVAVPDYRLFPAVRYPDFVEDGAAAVAYVRDHAAEFGGDPDRILLAGHSAGAYIAAMLAVEPSFLADAGVPRAAIRGFAGLSGPYDFYPFDVDASINSFGEAPDPEATQPVNHAGAGDPPTFLATGGDDTTVRPRNSEALAARLRAAGVPADLTIYPGLAHTDTLLALSRPLRGKAPVLADVAAFFRRVAAP